jgi:hypothetical protein
VPPFRGIKSVELFVPNQTLCRPSLNKSVVIQ